MDLPALMRPLGYAIPSDSLMLQHVLDDLNKYAVAHSMVLNTKKTQCIAFNSTHKYQFLPRLNLPGSCDIVTVKSTRLLGVMLDSKLSWWPLVNDVCTRAKSKLWALIRMKELGACTPQLLATYKARVRSITEYAAPLFCGLLNQEQMDALELVQKRAVAIVLGREYTTYERACELLQLESLQQRRLELTTRFAVKAAANPRHSSWFKKTSSKRGQREVSKQSIYITKRYIEGTFRTARHKNSSVPFMTSLLNALPPNPKFDKVRLDQNESEHSSV